LEFSLEALDLFSQSVFQFENSCVLLIQLGIPIEGIQGDAKTVEEEDGVEIAHGITLASLTI